MDTEKEILLGRALDKVYSIGFGLEPEEELEKYFSEKLMVIGTTVDEKFSSLDGMRVLIANQRKQSQGMDIKFERKEVFRDFRGNGDVAIVVEDLVALININDDIIRLDIRTSLVLEFINGQWKLVHWHASKPEMVQSEKDTFGIEEWKQKTSTLEKLVEERTADLINKNRELEIESSLERVRTVAMSMQKADDLLKVSEIMYKELVALGFSGMRNALVQTFEEGEDYFLDYDYSDFTGGCKSRIALKGHATVEKFVKDIRESKQPFTELVINSEELEKWKAFRKMNNEAEDPRLDNISALYYYCYATGSGSVGISTYSPISDDKREILKRFRNVFDFAYRRYIDVAKAEAQAREAQTELALERIRAKVTSMRESGDLLDIVVSMRTEFVNLGHEAHYFWHMRWLPEFYEKAMTSGDGTRIGMVMTLPRKIHQEIPVINKWEKGNDPTVVYTMDVDAALNYVEQMVSLGNFTQIDPNAPGPEAIRAIGGLTFIMARTTHGEIGFSLPGIVPIPSPDATATLVRFAGVFDLAYRRFEDLKKAEQQFREAQIELALERVRARTMAMQNSHELADASRLLDQQVRGLGINTWGCAFNIHGEHDSTEWFSSEAGILHAYKVPRENIFLRYYEAALASNELHIEEFSGDECTAHYEYLCTIPIVGDALKQVKESGGAFPAKQVDHVAPFRYGYLLFITLEQVPGAHDVFKRFATVFEQTYTRFLDLQKAEAQAREAQVEASLERIRAKAMSMHQSEELDEVLTVLFDQFDALGIESVSTHMTLIDIESNTFTFRETGKKGHRSYGEQTVAIDSMDIWKHAAGKWKSADPLTINYIHFPKESLPQVWQVFHQTFASMPEDARIYPEDYPDGIHHTAGNCKFGYIGMNQVRKATEEEEQIVIKFATEFGRLYQRFLDLKKAEAQAREAQIEVSLERVRARAMAMHRSEDLHEAVAVVFSELDKLELSVLRVGISVLNKEKRCGNVWLTSIDEGNAVQVYGDESFDIHPLLKGAMDAWIAQKDFYYVLEGEDLVRYYMAVEEARFMLPESQMLSKSGEHEKQSCFVAVYNSGGLFAFMKGEFPEEARQVMRRFAAVFDMTYQRFLDLQRAESQAREAMIEASLERVRSKAMAMHSSQDLADTIGVFYKELKSFSITPLRCGVGLLNKESRSGELFTWNTTETGESLELVGRLVMEGHPVLVSVYENWLSQTEYHPVLRGNEISAYYKVITPQMHFPEYPNDTVQYGYFFFFQEGAVYAWTQDIMAEKELDIYRRFTSVLSLTYKRYKDLQQAESLARQAEHDLVQLKEEKQRTEEALTELKNTQKQLIQAEKMASLGELTAGIAHEIQNPLNFVNNFSEVSSELISEMLDEVGNGNFSEVTAIASDLKQNLEKITHHGKRADGIVKGMLQHSRSSSAVKEPTDINALADEYLRLAYHGLRAKDKTFNATLRTDFDETIGRITIIPQDIGRVVLNLITNAFYVVGEKKKESKTAYEPTVSVVTKKAGGKVEIKVSDNGKGIPPELLDKIFQPFFTTKPTGQGTGLGLSLSYDIIKSHGGDLHVETKEGEGSVFIIQIPADIV